MLDNVQILDCTLRDGGLGLEDMQINGRDAPQFTDTQIRRVLSCLSASNLDIIEIGCVDSCDTDMLSFCIFEDISSLSSYIPVKRKSTQLFSALFRGPDVSLESIPSFDSSLCNIARVIIRYSELEKSLDYCKALANKGYHVCIQPMVTMRYKQTELLSLCAAANEMNAYALYIVDSYGYMEAGDVESVARFFDQHLNEEVRIGFHAHNNLNLALANTQSFLSLGLKRRLIVDSTICGMGQGAGNLQTELLVGQYIRANSTRFDFGEILDACELIEAMSPIPNWGYSLTNLLPAIHKVAYKYAYALRVQHGLALSDIHKIFKKMPVELKHRYSSYNLEQLLRQA